MMPPTLRSSSTRYSKVFHVRTNHNRLSGQDWFDRVLAANSAKALPHDHDARRGVPFPQFPGGVYDQDARVVLKVRVGAKCKSEVLPLQQLNNFGSSFGVPRNKNQKESRELGSEQMETGNQKLFFTGMQAATQQNGSPEIDAMFFQPGGKTRVSSGNKIFGVIFHAAGHRDSLSRDADTAPTYSVNLVLCENGRDVSPEERLGHASQFVVTLLRPRRQSSICQIHWGLMRPRRGQKRRPQDPSQSGSLRADGSGPSKRCTTG